MELLSALPDAEVHRMEGANPEVLGVVQDSRRVGAGDLFVAIRGENADGNDHVDEAISRGASAVVSEKPPPPSAASVPWVRVVRARLALGRLAARLAGDPAERLVLAGVTGTNGKTTTATLLAALLERRYGSAGFVGTVGYRAGGLELEAPRTTPEAPVLQELLARMVDAGIPAAALEVSSHALALDRVAGCRFDVAVFTNLTREHLDFHGDMNGYFGAKKRLFELRKEGAAAVVNIDDAYGARLAAELPEPVWTFSSRGLAADAVARRIVCDLSKTSFEVLAGEKTFRLASPLLGRFNVENILAAASAGLALGLSPDLIGDAVASVPRVPGRFERVDAGQPYPILVDYAHTPDALERLLAAVRDLSQKKIVLVFGCGGDRDRGKRAPMGEIAGRMADIAIATSDNPRSEDPDAILSQVEVGLAASGATKYLKIADRREAIRAAIDLANPGTIVVIAGKGHETTQVVGGRELPFDDREVARSLAAKR